MKTLFCILKRKHEYRTFTITKYKMSFCNKIKWNRK